VNRLALEIRGLWARLGDLELLKGIDLEVPFGQVHALMGPNGSGKSTLCHVLMGRPGYEVGGSVLVDGIEVLGKAVDARSRAGLFLAFQYPVDVPGVSLAELLDEMGGALPGSAAALGFQGFLDRPVNEGLSGGEKKRSELLQLLASDPRVALLDEIDSGLDVDAVGEVADLVERLRGPRLATLLITHYSRLLRHLQIDRVHVMVGGRIVRSGGSEVAAELEVTGYEPDRPAPGTAPEDPFAGL
jgi:Fe-S cluster assembly ATP-binding protein